ncbi:hypothetical protein OF83DRAFT_6750 [Amylostereum chailletii]|nr:hypothetical protein OF83DRAFT_6750 [Amylostereum chailletii]
MRSNSRLRTLPVHQTRKALPESRTALLCQKRAKVWDPTNIIARLLGETIATVAPDPGACRRNDGLTIHHTYHTREKCRLGPRLRALVGRGRPGVAALGRVGIPFGHLVCFRYSLLAQPPNLLLLLTRPLKSELFLLSFQFRLARTSTDFKPFAFPQSGFDAEIEGLGHRRRNVHLARVCALRLRRMQGFEIWDRQRRQALRALAAGRGPVARLLLTRFQSGVELEAELDRPCELRGYVCTAGLAERSYVG